MSRGNNWIGMDKNLSQEFKYIRREFSMIEAMYSYSLDKNCNREGSVNGYSKLWGWSRNKVRRFINDIRTGTGHYRDRKRTVRGQAIHFIDDALMNKKDRERTGTGQAQDRNEDTTIKPKPKPKIKPKKKKVFTPPLKEDVIKYFIENGYKEDVAIKAFNFYNVNNWKDSKDNPVKNWKQKMHGVWFKEENLRQINNHTDFKNNNYGDSTDEKDIPWMNGELKDDNKKM